MRRLGAVVTVLSIATAGAACIRQPAPDTSVTGSSPTSDRRSDKMSETLCFDQALVRLPWTVISANDRSVKLAASTDSLGLEHKDSPAREQQFVDVTVSWPFEPDGLPLGYLLASPARLREVVELGIAAETGKVLTGADRRWALSERITADIATYVDFENGVQCKGSSLEGLAGPNPYGFCQMIGAGNAFNVMLTFPTMATDQLPTLLSSLSDQIKHALRPCT